MDNTQFIRLVSAMAAIGAFERPIDYNGARLPIREALMQEMNLEPEQFDDLINRAQNKREEIQANTNK